MIYYRFKNTNELNVLKYYAIIEGSNRVKWIEAIEEECQKMQSNKCVEEVDRRKVESSKIITTFTWVMKRKSSGTVRAPLNIRSFEHIEGKNY